MKQGPPQRGVSYHTIPNCCFAYDHMGPVSSTPLYVLSDRLPCPDFGRLKTALARKKPDRVPLIELTVDEEVRSAFLGRPLTGMRDEVEFWVAAGYDYVPVWVTMTPTPVRTTSPERGTCKCGLGNGAKALGSKGTTKTKGHVESCQFPQIRQDMFKGFHEISPFLPSTMKVIGCVNGIFETVVCAMGFEHLCHALARDTDLVEAMFNKAGERITFCIEKMLEFKQVGAIWIADDLCHRQGSMISPKVLGQHVFPWFRRYCEVAHERGLPVLLHSCGNVSPLLDEIIDSGFDALHPLEPAAMDIDKVKAHYGDRICLCGTLDLSSLAAHSDLKQIEEETQHQIQRFAPGGGFCLGSASGISNHIPLEHYLTMNRTCLRLGWYRGKG